MGISQLGSYSAKPQQDLHTVMIIRSNRIYEHCLASFLIISELYRSWKSPHEQSQLFVGGS